MGKAVNYILNIMRTKTHKALESEFDWYLENQNDLVKKYNGKYLVIKDQEVIGTCDDELKAIRETALSHEMGTFLVQLCEPGKDSYSQTFHSRVSFG